MSNLTLLAIAITLLWLAAFGYYLYVSRQQRGISDEINQLREQLEDSDERQDDKAGL